MEQIKVLVKVGKSAKTILRNCKAIRAVTVDEMQYYLQNENINILIIEDIAAQECDNALGIIKDYLSKEIMNPLANESKKAVVMFNADGSNDNTLGLADELDCDIYDNTYKIWEIVENKFGVYVGRDIESIAKDLNGASIANDESNETFEFSSNTLENPYVDDDIELPSISNKSDIEEFSDKTVREVLEEHRKKIEKIRAHVNGTDEISEENIENSEIEQPEEVFSPLVESSSTGFMLNQVNKLNATIDGLNKKIESLQGRLAKEVELRGAIQEEKESLRVRLVDIIETKKVIEEKVPATEYRKIINKYNEVQEQLEKLVSDSNNSVAGQQAVVDELKEKIKTLEKKLSDKQTEISSLNESLIKSASTESANSAALQAMVESVNSKYEKAQEELERANKTIEDFEKQVKDNYESLKKLNKIQHHADVADKAHKMQSVVIANTLKILKEYASSNFDKDQAIEELNQGLDAIKLENESLSAEIKEKEAHINRLDDTIADLNHKVEEAEQSIVTHTAELQNENTKLRTDMMSANTQISTLRNQLVSKDNQYRILANSVGPTDPTTGQPRVVANLRMMEKRNRELQNQVVTLNQQLTAAMTESQTAVKSHQSLLAENQNLKRSLSAYIGNGYGTNGSMLQLTNPGGKAKIVAVFGSGSCGVSSMAFSIAQKLAAQNSVLIMDLDISTPKLDSYFKYNIDFRVPGVPNITTALELFLTQGIDRVWANATVLIPQVTPNNKNGKLWWFPGLYRKLDDTAIVTADWNALFRKISNSFDYIIIDCGKLNGNSPCDQLIQNISRIAYRSIVVCGTNFSDVRGTLKVMGKIRRDNLVWVLNQSLLTNISNPVKNLLINDKIEIIPFSQNSFGHRSSLLLDSMLRGRLEMFISNYIVPVRNRNGEG